MNRSLALGTACFGLSYLVIGLLAAAGLDAVGWKDPWLDALVTNLLVVPVAVVLGLRAGRLNVIGVLACSASLALAVQFAIVYILAAIARPAGGHVAWNALYQPPFLAGTLKASVVMVACPLLWLLVIRRVAPRLAANNSSKPTPLRGAA